MTVSIIIQQLKFSKLSFRSLLNYVFPVEGKNAHAHFVSKMKENISSLILN